MKLLVKLFFAGVMVVLPAAAHSEQQQWRSFITATELREVLEEKHPPLLIDVRSAEEYSAGHIPGAINIPATQWRTPKTKPNEGDSQYIFRKADGLPDIQRYEKLLGDAGLSRDQEVVIYGNFGGKADGSVPAFLLRWLGQRSVRFLDGIGVQQWQSAGGELSQENIKLAKTSYHAAPKAGWIWNLDTVVAHLNDRSVVYYDTRSSEEFTGENKRSNRYGGHIPGAVLLDYQDLLASDKTVLPPQKVQDLLISKGITPDKKVVLYCQTATRVTLPALALLDLGYKDIAVYDASWHEYGNREDTVIARGN